MRRSTKIFIAICAFALVYVIMVYMQVAGISKKEFKQADAVQFLNDIGEAFKREDSSAVLSFAWPDATVAGQDLKQIRDLLRRAFAQMKNPKVQYSDVRLINDRDFAYVNATVTVTDTGAGTVPFPGQPVGFKLERRKVSYLLNIIQSYDWKVVNVEANIPDASGM
jgi:hypothetical protein